MLPHAQSTTPPPAHAPRQHAAPTPTGVPSTHADLFARHQAEILSAFLRGTSIIELARASSTPLPQLLAFLGSPDARAVIAAFENTLSLQSRLISLAARAQAIRALERVCNSGNSPVESRRAASEILRLPECRTVPAAHTRARPDSDADDPSAANRIAAHHNTANSGPTNSSPTNPGPANPITEKAHPTHTQPASDSRALSEARSPMGASVGGGSASAAMHASATETGGRTEHTSKDAHIPAPSNQFIPQETLNLPEPTAAHQPTRPSTASQTPAPAGQSASIQSPLVQHPAQSRSPDIQPQSRAPHPHERLAQSSHSNATAATPRNPEPAAVSRPLPDAIPKVA